jgi:VanZ family protein
VQKLGKFLKYWLPILLWMSLIFGASSDSRSFIHSSRIVEPILRWLFPHLDDDTVNQVVFYARKGVHLTIYAILAMFLWRAVRQPVRNDRRPWSWKQAGLALLLAALYAASDEYHQTLVPHRDGCVRDVIIDTCGSTAGLLAIWQVGRWRKRW